MAEVFPAHMAPCRFKETIPGTPENVKGLLPITIELPWDVPVVVGSGTHSKAYVDWCIAERDRIRKEPGRVAIVVSNNGIHCCLWVNQSTDVYTQQLKRRKAHTAEGE